MLKIVERLEAILTLNRPTAAPTDAGTSGDMLIADEQK